MKMDVLRCKTPEMVRKEIWAHLLAYNLLRTVMAVAAAESDIEPRQISFKGAKQAVTAFAPKIEAARPEDRGRLIDAMLTAVAYHRVGDRPGRWEPRARKRRPKPCDAADATASRRQAAAESLEILLKNRHGCPGSIAPQLKLAPFVSSTRTRGEGAEARYRPMPASSAGRGGASRLSPDNATATAPAGPTRRGRRSPPRTSARRLSATAGAAGGRRLVPRLAPFDSGMGRASPAGGVVALPAEQARRNLQHLQYRHGPRVDRRARRGRRGRVEHFSPWVVGTGRGPGRSQYTSRRGGAATCPGRTSAQNGIDRSTTTHTRSRSPGSGGFRGHTPCEAA